MHIETISTGDELLTGLTSDTNSRFFQELLLTRTGLTVRRGVVVSDDRDDIIEALNQAATRCDVVLISGGLGPTADDVTAECAALAAAVPLVENANAKAHLVQRFSSRGIALSVNNLRQAQVPLGAEVVLNAEGSAPLIVQTRGRCVLFFVPGVPREYRHLVSEHVVPRITQLQGPSEFRKLVLLKTVGLPESHLDERVRPLMTQYPQVTFGFRTEPPENHLKLLARGADEASVDALLEKVVSDALTLLGQHCFARDAQTLPGAVLSLLRERKQCIAVAESCTGGLLAEQLTSEPKASDVFYGGVCTYQEAAKTQWAHVPPMLLAKYGAVSAETAEAMAQGLRSATKVPWALSTTGWAGPGGGDAHNPVGTVYLALAGPTGVQVEKHRFHGDRQRVRSFATAAALDLARRTLEGKSS